MAFGEHTDATQYAWFLIIMVCSPFCIIATSLRFVSSRLSLRRTGPDDWFALAALICYLASAVISTVALHIVNGTPFEEMPLPKITTALKLNYTTAFFFMPNQLFAKGSILLLYHRVFGVIKSYERCIYALAAAQFALTIANIFGSAFQCTPVKKFWDVTYVGGHCINLKAYLAGSETVNALIDFAMVILALVMLRELTLNFQTKFRLTFVFVIGGFAGVIGFIKFGMAYKPTLTARDEILLGLWATVQMICSVLCCCIITYKPLLGRTGFFSRLASKLSTSASKSRLSQKGSSNGPGSQSENSAKSAGWSELDRAENRNGQGFVATEIKASKEYNRRDHSFDIENSSGDSGELKYPMKIMVQRTVENV